MPTLQMDRPKRGRPKLSDAMEAALFAGFCKAARAEDLAIQFGVCRATVYNIVKRLKENPHALDGNGGSTSLSTGCNLEADVTRSDVQPRGDGEKEG